MINDERGADSLPLGIVTCTIVAAVILGLVAYGLSYALPVVDSAMADSQVSKADGELQGLLLCSPRNLLDSGSSQGTTRTISFSLPAVTEYVAFGFDPEGNSSIEGAIYYKIHGARKVIIVDTEVKFREAEAKWGRVIPSDRHLKIPGGKRDVQFEYVYSPATGQKYLISR